MSKTPGGKAIWAVPVNDEDWKDAQGNILPQWETLVQTPDPFWGGFGDTFYPLPDGPVDIHHFNYAGGFDHRTTFIGVSLWEDEWYGESPALAPTEEQRQALQDFLDKVGLEKTPALYALLSYG